MAPDSSSVLVVEDEPSVRALVQDILCAAGYTVRETGDPWEALEVEESYPIRPKLKVLFMSPSAIDDLLEPDAHFIAKPFRLDGILHRLDQVLGA